MLLVKLPVNNRLLVQFLGIKSYTQIFNWTAVSTPAPLIVHGSTAIMGKLCVRMRGYMGTLCTFCSIFYKPKTTLKRAKFIDFFK